MKWHLNQTFLGGRHYAWCSTTHDCRAPFCRDRYALKPPPSSNPAEIYEALKEAVKRQDRGDLRISGWKTSLLGLTAEWRASGRVTPQQAEDITYLLQEGGFEFWRPLMYIIDGSSVGDARRQLVAPGRRAGPADEFIIEDLAESEFDVLEY